MGLALARSIVEADGGRTVVEVARRATVLA
jgi:hypothetical protein